MSRPDGNARSAAPWRWAIAGSVLGALAVAIFFAPAEWLALAIGHASAHKVLLQEARGTVWSGSSRLVFSGGAGSRDRTELSGRIRWQLRPALLHVSAELATDCCTPHGPLTFRLTPHWSGMTLTVGDGSSAWPVALLSGLGTPWNTIRPEGAMNVGTHGLQARWSAGHFTLAGSAELRFQEVSTRLSTLRPIGSYRLDIRGGETTSVTLATVAGALQLSGAGKWVGSRLHFSGEAQAAPEQQAQLSNLMNIMGKRSGNRAILAFN